jgi:hypothetical protein
VSEEVQRRILELVVVETRAIRERVADRLTTQASEEDRQAILVSAAETRVILAREVLHRILAREERTAQVSVVRQATRAPAARRAIRVRVEPAPEDTRSVLGYASPTSSKE